MYQRWSDLLFLHWKWDTADLQSRLPDGLYVDTFDGEAWLGVVPFYMQRIRPRFLPPVPGISWFLELNVRTYVHDDHGRPGVWFFSLDCDQPLAVWAAQTFFHLPYQNAAMKADKAGQQIHYQCERAGLSAPATFDYTLTGPMRSAEPGTLEFFLAERYLLFSSTPRGLCTGQVHHVPYPIAKTSLDSWSDAPLLWNGWPAPLCPPDHVLGSPGVDVEIFPLQS
jgi:uncharacterized protein